MNQPETDVHTIQRLFAFGKSRKCHDADDALFFSWYFPLFPLFSSLPPVCTVYDTTSISKVQSCTFYDAVDSTLQHIRFLTLHTFLLLLGHVDLTSSTSRSDMM